MPWIPVAPTTHIPPGGFMQVEIDDTVAAVFNIDGTFYAIEDVCTHDGGELACGHLEGDVITCPRHGARFSVRTGEVLAPPAYEATRTFNTRITDGIVEIEY